MLTWDAVAVEDFLGTPPVFEDNSSYTFSFSMLGQSALLRIYPETNDVELEIGKLEHERAAWRLECSEISYNDDHSGAGGDCLVFKPMDVRGKGAPMTHWMVIGRDAAGFNILTVFRACAG